MGSLRGRHGWATSLSLFTFMHWRRKWQPTPASCLENPRDGGAWWASIYGIAQSRTRLKRLSSSSSTACQKWNVNHQKTHSWDGTHVYSREMPHLIEGLSASSALLWRHDQEWGKSERLTRTKLKPPPWWNKEFKRMGHSSAFLWCNERHGRLLHVLGKPSHMPLFEKL